MTKLFRDALDDVRYPLRIIVTTSAKRVSRMSSPDSVAATLLDGIKSGRYVPGQRLIEADLTAELDVSRGPVREALKRLAAEGVTDKELADAKTYLTGSYPLRFDTNDKIAGQLIAIQEADLGIDYITRRNGLIEDVTQEDIKRVAARLLGSDNLIVTVVGQPEGLGEN